MATAAEKPKHRFRKVILYISGAAALILIAFLCYMALHENQRHTQLESGIDSLQAALKIQGIETQKNSGCGRPYSEIGREAKHCALGLSTKMGTRSIEEANKIFVKYATTLNSDHDFEGKRPLPQGFPHVMNGFDFGNSAYLQRASGRNCSADFQLDLSQQALNIDFSCDDTSWFVKTFEN